MIPERLEPHLDLLQEEYVLVQAWKKTASYIRYHNWFSDVLALDCTAVNLPAFLGEIRERLRSSNHWENDSLRIVPAPKSQHWRIRADVWEPLEKGKTAARLRPLAYVSFADQVLATALMLCLADRVETMQGNPLEPICDLQSRKRVISYGNRLFCDAIHGELRHRWGSSKLYRAYYQDYRTFLSRPEVVAESLGDPKDKRVFVVQADLRQFYDRVRPDRLAVMMERLQRNEDDPAFFELAASVLDWSWSDCDKRLVQIYADQAELEDFSRVALPQGLVASGFFANIALLSFDDAARAKIGEEIAPGIMLEDVSRYVDDLRVVIAVDDDSSPVASDEIAAVTGWLEGLLLEHAPGLTLATEKTQIAALDSNGSPLVRQSARMSRIQSAVSGGFDALGGEEIIDAIQGLMRAQEALSLGDNSGWQFSPVPDVRDETVARFGAARYRTTFRSIRPLLQSQVSTKEFHSQALNHRKVLSVRVARTRRELDEDARTFALGLIQRWIDDPANVRLLRIGLDLWPDVKFLREILSLLRPSTEKSGWRKASRQVAWYCLSEVLRAGATETGLVPDSESLPSGIDLQSYREELCKEADRLVRLPKSSIPWYLRQQALLFLAAFDPARVTVACIGKVSEIRHYRDLIRFLRGEGGRLQSSDFATLAAVARRAFLDRERAIGLTWPNLTPARMIKLAQRDPSFLLELITKESEHVLCNKLPPRVREDLCRTLEGSAEHRRTLAAVVLNNHPIGPFRNELSVLKFAVAFLKQWEKLDDPPQAITPVQIELKLTPERDISHIDDLRILEGCVGSAGSLYEVPYWCEPDEKWRFQLGFLIRFILSGQTDFTRPVRPENWKERESAYRPAESHWYQRLYGLYSGQPAFGDDWLPITDWIESFLLALLQWPGCRTPEGFVWVGDGLNAVKKMICRRINDLEGRYGAATNTLILPMIARQPTATIADRPLLACVVQTVVPRFCEFHQADLTLNEPMIRQRHRNHLSAALAAVDRMLALRETHKGIDGRLDWLILPELAVHPDDVHTHLIPFARVHKAIILTGLTYQELIVGQPLVNSALWVIPEWSDTHGLQVRTRRQGKLHLAQAEQQFNQGGAALLQGFRPCQWLIGYPWSNEEDSHPLWLTAAVCYDATDLGLAADLRNQSDVFAIPALNHDVKTFDQMALALHYHMFQLVIVANNGEFGGSNAYWPSSNPHTRQVFHTHGQPQTSISFLEIDDIQAFLARHDVTRPNDPKWKYPPAGITR